MNTNELILKATGNHEHVQDDWMPVTAIRSIVFEDPAVIWLNYHGKSHKFAPDKETPYDFLKFIRTKGREFEEKWAKEILGEAIKVCQAPYDVRVVEHLEKTIHLIHEKVPVIVQPALWWKPERIYGVPDIIIHSAWLKEKFPDWLTDAECDTESYYVFDLKFTTAIDSPKKQTDFKNYAAQIRIYSYILGYLQNSMPPMGFIISRDRIYNPLPVEINSMLNEQLDTDLAGMRDHFLEIKLNGNKYVPWKDDVVKATISDDDEKWATAKKIIATEKTVGGDPVLVYKIGEEAKNTLQTLGFTSLQTLLANIPEPNILQRCRGIGEKTRSKSILFFKRMVPNRLSLHHKI